MPEENIESIKKVIKLLKVNDFSVILGRTSHGELAFKVPKEGDAHFTLDAVPLEKEMAEELSKAFSGIM